MPPVGSERSLISHFLKEKKKMSLEEWDKYVKNRLFIDVNDPRYDYILHDMKAKNENLRQLLEEDSKNPLSNLLPFRHQLLLQKYQNPKLRDALIPMLEKDIVNDPALLNFIEKYCKEEGKKELAEGINKLAEAMRNERQMGFESI